MWRERMRDSAYALNIKPTSGIAYAGYLPGGSVYHAWAKTDWAIFGRSRKLPIFVATMTDNRDGKTDAFTALRGLYDMGVPRGVYTALDLENLVVPSYVTNYWHVMQWAGYKVWPYGQASTLFGNPKCDGYWVADWAGQGPFMYSKVRCRATQYADPTTGSGGQWDSSTMQAWTYAFGSWWR